MSTNLRYFFMRYMPKHSFSVMKHDPLFIINNVTKFIVNVKKCCFVFKNFLLLRHLFEEKAKHL